MVIPIRNEGRYIAGTLAALQGQDYPDDRLEILVVDGDSNDDTVAIVEGMAAEDNRIRLCHNSKRLASAARNIGAKNASGEIITFIDGHTYIDNRRLLKSIARLISEKEVSVLSRPQYLDTPENTDFQKAVSVARKSFIGHGLDSTIYTANEGYVDPTSSGASYRRVIFEEVGYFDERFDACEDLEFNHRVGKAGHRAFTSMKLAVYYYPRSTLRALFRQMKRYGIGRARMAIKHPDSLSVGVMMPALFTLGLIAMPLLSLIWKPFIYLFCLCYGAYATVILTTSLYYTMKSGLTFFPILPVIYFVIHTGLGWGFLTESGKTLFGKGLKESGEQ